MSEQAEQQIPNEAPPNSSSIEPQKSVAKESSSPQDLPHNADKNVAIEALAEQTNDRKGRYDNLDDALGQEIKQLINDSEHVSDVVKIETPKNVSDEIENNLLKYDAQVVRVSQYPERLPKYYIEKKLDENRKVIIVSKDIDYVFNEKTQKYDGGLIIDKLIIQGPKGKCVNFAERLSPGTDIVLRFDETLPIDAMKKSTENFWYSPSEEKLCFGRIDSLSDIAAVWHEGGHAEDFIKKDRIERKMSSNAHHVLDEAMMALSSGKLNSIGEIEKKYDMDFLQARYIIAKNERTASLWAISDLEKIHDDLGIVPEMADLYKHDIESWWQSYDKLVLPNVGTSELVRSMGKERGQSAFDHLNNYSEMRDWLEEYGIKDEGTINYSDDQSSFKLSLKEGEISFLYFPTNPEGDANGIAIFSNYHYSRMFENILKNGASDYKISTLDMSTPQKYLDSQAEHKDVLEGEKFVIHRIVEAHLAQEKETLKKIEFIKAAFKPIFPDQTRIDPAEVVKKLSEYNRISNKTFESTDLDFITMAANPFDRLEFMENNLLRELSMKSNKTDLQDHKFNPTTGRPLSTSHDKLIYLCEELLGNVKIPEGFPDRSKFQSTAEYDNAVMELTGKHVRIL